MFNTLSVFLFLFFLFFLSGGMIEQCIVFNNGGNTVTVKDERYRNMITVFVVSLRLYGPGRRKQPVTLREK